MTSRSEMREAKRSAGICVEPTCGNKAQEPWEHCEKHIPKRAYIQQWDAAQRQEEKVSLNPKVDPQTDRSCVGC